MASVLAHLPDKTCSKCGETKPRDAFSERKQTTNIKEYVASNAYCKPCAAALVRERRLVCDKGRQAEIQRKSKLKRTYGISLPDFVAMLDAQNGRCAICKTDKPGGKGVFQVDHCHATGDVRGLLCCNCNRGIGALKDNVKLLQRAIAYLENPPWPIN